jgi:short-subunit dehydrogenase
MATALITGGTAGIGAAFARTLAARGDNLVLVARNADRLAEMAADLKQRYAVDVETISADLSVREDVQRVAQRAESPTQPVDLVINNAGFGIRARLLDDDVPTHDHAIDVMIRAVLVISGAAGRAMSARGHGTIINVSSTAGFIAMGNYSAVKAWVTAYSEGLSNELHGTGVHVMALCPGWVRTEFHERADINTGTIPAPMWLDADRLVRDALADAAAGKVISIPSTRYRVLLTVARHLPRGLIRTVSRRLSSSRH